MVVSATTADDKRAELERLRKLKRLRELEAKAGVNPSVTNPQASQPAPFAIDTEEDIRPDINKLLMTAGPAGMAATGMKAPVMPEKPKAKAKPLFYGKGDDRGFFVPEGAAQMDKEREEGVPNLMAGLAGRAGASTVNSFLGGLDFLSEPGRWADNMQAQIPIVGDYLPAFVWDDKGAGFHFNKDLTEEQKNYTALPRIPMPEAKNDAEVAADMVGEAAGFVIPGMAVNKAMNVVGKGAQKLPGVASTVGALTAKGSDAAARGARYGQRMVSTIPEAGVQAFTFGASNADRYVIDEETGDVRHEAENPVDKGLSYAGNPMSYLAPLALSGIYRSAIGLKSGGKTVTPKAVRAQVAPHILSSTDEAIVALGDLPIPAGIAEKDADKALGILHRSLKNGGVPDDVMAAEVKAYNELPGDRPAPAVFLRSRLAAYPKAVENLDNALYEIGQKAASVGDALRNMRTSQADRLKAGLRDTLGKGDRVKRDAKLKGDLEDMGEEAYEPILAAGPVDDEAANTLRAMLNDTEFASEIPIGYRTKLSMNAINTAPEAPTPGTSVAKPGQTGAPHQKSGPDLMGGDPLRGKVALQQRIAENPLEVAHKLYSSLGTRIRDARGTDTSKLKEIRDAIRPHLMKAGGQPYQKVNADYAATSKARRALGAPDKLFTESLKSHQVAKVKETYAAMSQAEKESYKTSLKGLLEDELRRASANNDFVNLGRMKKEGVLDAIDEILDVSSSKVGSRTSQQIRNILDEQDTIKGVDPEAKTGRNDRLASGREAYAGKTGALEHTGKYGLNELAQDAAVSAGANLVLPGSSAVVPIRAIVRLGQKALSAMATPSRSARDAAGRIALEQPGVAPRISAKKAALRAARQAAAKAQYRMNGKFGGKPEFLDPEAPQPRGFDDEGFARSMSDDGTPKIPGGGGSAADDALTVIDEGYDAAPPRQKKLPGKQKLLGSNSPVAAGAKSEDKPDDVPKTAAERYVDELRNRQKELEARADEAARAKDSARGDRRAAERSANDAERIRAQNEAIKNQTQSEALKAERERERQMMAEERARKAASEAEELLNVGPPDNTSNGPFSKLGRARDRAMAPAGDPRSLKDVMNYLVGDSERALVSANMRRFGRDANMDWTNASEINRANEILRAAQGQMDNVSPDVRDMVGRLNPANKKWLVDQLSEPQNFDLLEIMGQIDNLPTKGKLELEYAATGPLAVGAGGVMAAIMGGKALYDAREKRTPAQIEADLRKYYTEGEEVFQAPDASEVRKMQAALNALGITDRYGNTLTVDGKMGDRFREAVLDFAERNGLQPHGLNPGSLSDKIVTKLRDYYQ